MIEQRLYIECTVQTIYDSFQLICACINHEINKVQLICVIV